VHNRGIVVTALLSLAVAASVSGCSSFADDGWTQTGGLSVGKQALAGVGPTTATAPTAGECWQFTYEQVLEEPQYPTGDPISCSTPHQGYTYAVIPLNSTSTGPPSAASETSEENEANDVCSNQFAAILPTVSAYIHSRLLIAYSVAPIALQEQGQHWARCDINELQVGSPFVEPTLADLPSYSHLLTEAAAEPIQFAFCANTPGSTGSTGPNLGQSSTIGDCRTARWRLEPTVDELPYPAGTPYPGFTGLDPYMHAHCGAIYDSATVRGWIYYPSAQDWADGSRSFSCWVGSR
jgi:hypothetical protein